jgi:hypothetical protein
MNAAGHDEKRAGHNHETHVIERGVEHPSSRAEGENIIRRNGRETETKLVIVPFPMVTEDRWRERD